ncbi:hypothetical protein OPV22_000542 [Ensete ventricosum]|uniref:Uncharacterized protein n=1 Tax=Ensete ventricosum TaxID=4639 RepID=A0AAV8RRY8_ENSVE|nr:hypothetical protein OPV22_000542 [Ensete ventricosum]
MMLREDEAGRRIFHLLLLLHEIDVNVLRIDGCQEMDENGEGAGGGEQVQADLAHLRTFTLQRSQFGILKIRSFHLHPGPQTAGFIVASLGEGLMASMR